MHIAGCSIHSATVFENAHNQATQSTSISKCNPNTQNASNFTPKPLSKGIPISQSSLLSTFYISYSLSPF